jgi:Zn-dependent protease
VLPFLNLNLVTFLSRIIVLLISLTVHEFAHAWTANYYGDDTPRLNGRLTLNPLAHLDPLGSLLLLVYRFGWAKPVPVNPYALQRRSSAALMWVSLAGPLSNLSLAILAAGAYRLMRMVFSGVLAGSLSGYLSAFMLEFITINLLLMLFNLIPLAPLDGEKVATYLLPPSWSQVLSSLQPYGPLILLGILFIIPITLKVDVVGWIIGGPLRLLYSLLVG